MEHKEDMETMTMKAMRSRCRRYWSVRYPGWDGHLATPLEAAEIARIVEAAGIPVVWEGGE